MTRNKIVIPQYKIERRVRQLAIEISEDWIESNADHKPPVMLCVLNGAFMFFADLVQNLDIECEVDFIRVKSYEGKDNSGGLTIVKPPEADLANRTVYIVEDLIDSGQTIKELIHLIGTHTNDINVVTLLHRAGSTVRLPEDVKHFNAFEIGDEWVVGYGLDDNKLKRNYTNIYDFK